MFTFERFRSGESYGIDCFTLTAEAVARWRTLFPDDDGPLMPPGMTAVVVMRAYNALIAPRPPGNIHGAQRFEMHALPRIGETLSTRASCAGKELRKGRRWVYLAFETRRADGDLAFLGRFTSLVAG